MKATLNWVSVRDEDEVLVATVPDTTPELAAVPDGWKVQPVPFAINKMADMP